MRWPSTSILDFRPWATKARELFDLGSVQKIALYSKGIPRLINVICDNALLIAYATSQSQISAKIVDEVAATCNS